MDLKEFLEYKAIDWSEKVGKDPDFVLLSKKYEELYTDFETMKQEYFEVINECNTTRKDLEEITKEKSRLEQEILNSNYNNVDLTFYEWYILLITLKVNGQFEIHDKILESLKEFNR